MRRLLICWLFLAFMNADAQDKVDRQVTNLEAFAKLYGYVRYFHPSDEAENLDWTGFAMYGSKKVMNAANDKELMSALQELFTPIAPTVKIFIDDQKVSFDPKSLMPADTTGYKTIAWQHFGVGNGSANSIYTSKRTNRTMKTIGETNPTMNAQRPVIREYPLPGEVIQRSITPNLKIIVPLALYGNNESTYPVADKQLFNDLVEKCKSARSSEFYAQSTELRAGGVIIAWNVFRHFFPYWNGASKKPEEILHSSLQRALSDKSMTDYLTTLRLMTEPLNDGHVYISNKEDSSTMYHIPVLVDYVEGKIVVEKITDPSLTPTIQPGDVVIKVDGIDSKTRLEQREALISGSPQWKHANSRVDYFSGARYTEVKLTLQRGERTFDTTLLRTRRLGEIFGARNKRQPSGMVNDNIMYIDLNVLPIDSIKKRQNEILAAKGVIFDLRGYPRGNHEVISWLLRERDTTKWMFIPQVIYPDYDKVNYYSTGWFMTPSSTVKLTSKVVFITDGRAISYAESFMGHIKDLKLATIIGGPTAGTNGNVNTIELPGGYNVSWTGMLVKNHDGSRHHVIGIVPDIPVNRTIKGIAEGRDEFLEKAISLVSQ